MLRPSGGSGGETVAPFASSVTVDATTTLKTGGTPDWHGRAAVKRRASDDVLVLVFQSASAHAVNDGALHIRFSDDNGATWTADDTTLAGGSVSGFPMTPPNAASGEDAGEPWLYVTPDGDLILHMWEVDYNVSNGGTWQSRSTDGGETWSTPTQVDFTGIGSDDNIFATDDDFTFDRVIYAAARVYSGGDTSTASKVIFIKSDDDGASWEYVSDVTGTGYQEMGFEYVGNQTIVGLIRSRNNDQTLQASSTDMGATWTTTDVTSTVEASGRHRIYTRMHLQGEAGWWKDPVLIAVGFELTNPGNSQGRRNAVWVSPDRGTTWEGPHYLDTAADDGGYGDIFWNGSGYTVISNRGTLVASDLKQYDLSISLS